MADSLQQPTLMEIVALADEVEEEGLGQVDLVRRALARWGRPAVEPVLVSEMLPRPEDCDAEGRCWVFFPGDRVSGPVWMHHASEELQWLKTQDKETLIQISQRGRLTWLPHNALPIPTSQED